jgi:FtsP/CotA-like multicopper oxidase with cupredoxin domain
VSRRSLIRLALAGAGIAASGPALARTGLLDGADGAVRADSIPGVVSADAPFPGPTVPKFERDLVIPPTLAPTTSTQATKTARATRTYDLEHRVSTQQILPAPFPATEVWAYNGIVPGPTIRQQRGGPLTFVRNKNSLPAGHPYSMHLHGSPSQPFFDGHPDDLTPVGATKTYKYPNSQEARTLWYHDHAIHQTAEHVYKGLAGFFIHDPSAADVTKYGLDALPSGKYDVPLMVGDMQFRTDGTVAYDDKGHDSLWGNVNVVNGRAWPKMHVDRTRYRFRMLVGSVSRSYNFALSNGAPITMIGTDAGLLPAPVQVSSFRHGMAERYDVVIDFSRFTVGTKITLLNTAADGDMRQVMQFVVDGPEVASRPVPARLNDVMFPQESAVVQTRHFKFDRSNSLWTINGIPWDGVVAAKPKVGTTEKWVLETNSGGWFHPVHIHLVDFQILRRNGGPVFPYEQGWKDVAYVGANETVEVLMTFHEPEVIDPAHPTLGKFVMHCHNLVHEDHDMMNQFEIQPGAAPTNTTGGTGGTGGTVKGRPAMAPMMMVQWELEA